MFTVLHLQWTFWKVSMLKCAYFYYFENFFLFNLSYKVSILAHWSHLHPNDNESTQLELYSILKHLLEATLWHLRPSEEHWVSFTKRELFHICTYTG